MNELQNKKQNIFKRLLKSIGPGFVTGAADDDPSGIGTYSQTGVMFGFSQLWIALFTYPFMVAVQEMCGRIGMVTGRGLSGVIKKNYSKKLLYSAVFILLIANVINIGADLSAMASSAQLFVNLPYVFWLVVITMGTLLLEIFVPYPVYSKFLKILTLSLLSYVATAFIIKQDWAIIFWSTIVPNISFTKEYLLNMAAFLGTTISPYLFFWQADEEVEEEIVNHQITDIGVGVPKINDSDIKQMRIDTASGMFFSNTITFFIMVTVASTLGLSGIKSIDTAAQAASALKPLAGDFAFVLFAIGIIGVGLLAVPVLAGSAAYAISEAFDWKLGLGKKFGQAHGFYIVIALATIFGLAINFLSIGPITMLYYAAALNGVLAPPLMIFILMISNNKKILGERVNGKWTNILGWVITAIMSFVAIALIISLA